MVNLATEAPAFSAYGSIFKSTSSKRIVDFEVTVRLFHTNLWSIVFDAQASLKNKKVALLVILRGHWHFGF